MKTKASAIDYRNPDWTFKTENVAGHFNQHVREQLPWYDLATGMVAHLARNFVTINGQVYDIGTSTGNIAECVASVVKDRHATLTAIDESQAMISQYKSAGIAVCCDAAEYKYKSYDFAVCFLMLSFVAKPKRARLLNKLAKKIENGGCLLVVDKFEMPKGYASNVLRNLTIAGKAASGAVAADIVRKQLSLIGVQRPLQKQELTNLPMVTAKKCFQFGEFAGWMVMSNKS